MKSLRSVATALQDPPDVASTLGLAKLVAMPLPVSTSKLIDELLAPVHFQANVETPPGTALGGSVDVTMESNGHYNFNVAMHDSGADPYTFRIRCVVRSPGGVALVFQVSGHTDGTGSNLLGKINRDFDHTETGVNPLIQQYWLDIRASSMAVSKSYDDVGLLGTFEDVAKDLLGFLAADAAFGSGLALVICVSADIANAAGATFVGPGGLVGVAVSGGVVWMFGPAAIIPALVAGVVAGAATDALIKHRQLTDDEYAFAGIVYGDTLPPRERIYVTNLSSGKSKYTWPELDGSVILNMDDAYDDPVHYSGTNNYRTQGQVFIHEMGHAWQIRTKSFTPGLICKRIFETTSYKLPPPSQTWSTCGMEQQAAIVDTWFGTYASQWGSIPEVITMLKDPKATSDPYFHYIANNIRMGQN